MSFSHEDVDSRFNKFIVIYTACVQSHFLEQSRPVGHYREYRFNINLIHRDLNN